MSFWRSWLSESYGSYESEGHRVRRLQRIAVNFLRGMPRPVLAFVLTVLLEWPVLAWLSGEGFRATALFCLCLNGATWGTAMGVLAIWPVPIPILEFVIFLAEAVLLAWFWNWRAGRALVVSLAMNITSWWIGSALLSLLTAAP
jgi:hypothetical protein